MGPLQDLRAPPPRWAHEGRGWPLREHSHFIDAGGLTWHVQRLGRGPEALLLHGAGAAGHSWRDVAPRLADRFTLLVPDLPGHGFTDRAATPDLDGMSRALVALLEAEGATPRLVVGHSAGAAILAYSILKGRLHPSAFVAINPAFWPLPGLAGQLFPWAARWMAKSTLTPRLVARRARDPGALRRIIEGTGSDLDPEGVALYRRLASSAGHVAGTLDMLAAWELSGLADDIVRLATPTRFVFGQRDRTLDVPRATRLAHAMPSARIAWLEGGHLAHEEAPDAAARLISEALEPEEAP